MVDQLCIFDLPPLSAEEASAPITPALPAEPKTAPSELVILWHQAKVKVYRRLQENLMQAAFQAATRGEKHLQPMRRNEISRLQELINNEIAQIKEMGGTAL